MATRPGCTVLALVYVERWCSYSLDELRSLRDEHARLEAVGVCPVLLLTEGSINLPNPRPRPTMAELSQTASESGLPSVLDVAWPGPLTHQAWAIGGGDVDPWQGVDDARVSYWRVADWTALGSHVEHAYEGARLVEDAIGMALR